MASAKYLSFLKKEWAMIAFYSFIIILLSATSNIFAKGNGFINLILFAIGFEVFAGFILTSNNIYHNEDTGNKLKSIIWKKDKRKYDIFILFIFFIVITVPFKGLMIALSLFPYGQELMNNIRTVPSYSLSYSISVTIFYSIYRTAMFIGFANLVYRNKEVLESFKFGFQNIFTILPVFIAVLALNTYFFLFGIPENLTSSIIAKSISYLLPSFLIVFTYSWFHKENEKAEVITAEA